MEHPILHEVLILFGVAIVVVAAFRRLQLPPILGYLTVGLIAGPHAFGWLAFDEVTRFLGELGIVFLLFTIGLEFSLPLLLHMRKELLGVGSLQVTGGTLAGMGIALAFGVPWQAALVFGAATALSSTAIVLKQLAEQHELQQRHGRLAVGILLFQDLAAVPFLIMIPILAAGDGQLAGPLGMALVKGVAAFLIMMLIGRWVLPRALHAIAAARSPELFTLAALFVALATAWATSLFGLSLALGAFLAGMMLGETAYRHQIETDVRPFRDLLMGLFFVTVGMELDFAALPGMWLETLILILGIVLGKGLLIVALVRAIGNDTAVAWRTGAVLAHGGEFGIALLALALGQGLLAGDTVQPVLAAMIISMLIAPLMVRHNEAVARWLSPRQVKLHHLGEVREIRRTTGEMADHVVIAGFGRLGQNLSAFLRKLAVSYVALDLDAQVVSEARRAGEPVFYGDSTHRWLLDAAGLRRARALVITYDAPEDVKRTLHVARELRPDVFVLVRTRDDRELEALLAEGVDEVMPESLESSVTLAYRLLCRLGFDESDVFPLVEGVRRDRYHELRALFPGEEAAQQAAPFPAATLRAVTLAASAAAVGRSLGELRLGDLGVEVAAIRRRGIRGEQPQPTTCLEAGDTLLLEGGPEDVQRATARLVSGTGIEESAGRAAQQ